MMKLREKFANKTNTQSLVFLFIAAICIVALLICITSLSLYYISMNNMVDILSAESVENSQNKVVTEIVDLERDLNKTTFQLLNSKFVHDITSTEGDYSITAHQNAQLDVQSMTSSYMGLLGLFIINTRTKNIFNNALHSNSEIQLNYYTTVDEVFENHNNAKKLYVSEISPSSLIITCYDFRGFIVVYIFEQNALVDTFFDNNLQENYNSTLLYKNNFILTDSPGNILTEDKKEEHHFIYEKDNYILISEIIPQSLDRFYSPFLKQIASFTFAILLISIVLVIFFANYMSKKTKKHISTLMAHSRQHHYIAIKSILQRSIRNQFVAQNEQVILSEFFNKIKFKELFCFQFQLDNINSLLLSHSYKDISEYMQNIMLILEDSLSMFGTCIMVDIDFDSVGLILAAEEIFPDSEIHENIAKTREKILDLMDLTITVAATDSIISPIDITTTFIHLNSLIKYRFFTGYNSTITDSFEINQSIDFPSKLQNQISALYVTHNTEELLLALDEFFNEVSKTSYEDAKKWVLDLAMTLSKALSSLNDTSDIIFELSQADTLEIQHNVFIKHFVDFENNNKNISLSNDAFVEQTNTIIEKEFSSLNFNLTSYAELLDISVAYAGKKFKKEFNTSFNAYLAEFRVKKALDLLSTSNYKIAEIGEMCGFGSTAYFIKTFKKITSMTPTDYRKS